MLTSTVKASRYQLPTASGVSALAFMIIIGLCFINEVHSVKKLAKGVKLPEGLTLRHLLINRHIYEAAHRNEDETSKPTEDPINFTIDFQKGENATGVMARAAAPRQAAPINIVSADVLYGNDDVQRMAVNLAKFCSKQKGYHYASLDDCKNSCNPPCEGGGISCPWRYCRETRGNECRWSCASNSVFRGLIAGISAFLALIALICFCRAWGNFKNRFNAIVMDD